MDSSLENATLIDALEELSKDGLLEAIDLTRVASDANLMKHLLKKRERKAQAAHGRKPK